MNSTLSFSPTARFSSRNENYVKYRRSYPDTIIPFLEQKLSLKSSSRIADIGSGSGLFAEPFLQKGYRVICLEPDDEMRQAGEDRLRKYAGYSVRKHRAEATGLRGHTMDLITVALPFRWLNIPATRREFSRILKTGGHVVLAWNLPAVSTEFSRNYKQLIERYQSMVTGTNGTGDIVVPDFFTPHNVDTYKFSNLHWLNFDALKGQLLSGFNIPLPGHASYETLISELVQLFVNFNENGFVKMEFETCLYIGRLSG